MIMTTSEKLSTPVDHSSLELAGERLAGQEGRKQHEPSSEQQRRPPPHRRHRGGHYILARGGLQADSFGTKMAVWNGLRRRAT